MWSRTKHGAKERILRPSNILTSNSCHTAFWTFVQKQVKWMENGVKTIYKIKKKSSENVLKIVYTKRLCPEIMIQY